MAEEWRAIQGYEGDYEVSSEGRLRSLTYRGKSGTHKRCTPLLLRLKRRSGYQAYCFSRQSSRRTLNVGPLVLAAFVGEKPPSTECTHLDGDPTNDRLDNLAWRTHAENEQDKKAHGTATIGERCHQARLNADQVRAIRLRVASGERVLAIASEYGVDPDTIYLLVNRKTWRHVA